jgi:hypothetical protein
LKDYFSSPILVCVLIRVVCYHVSGLLPSAKVFLIDLHADFEDFENDKRQATKYLAREDCDYSWKFWEGTTTVNYLGK